MAAEAHLERAEDRRDGIDRATLAIVGERGRQLYVRRWAPVDALYARPDVVLVHGFGEHIARYDGVAGAFAAAGHVTWGMDLWGHGGSPGRRADVGRLDLALSDLDALLAHAKTGVIPSERSRTAPAPSAPGPFRTVLYGHSMGGALAAAYAATRPSALSALVLSAPALHLALRPRWQALGIQALAAVLPRAAVAAVDPRELSHDPAVVKGYAQDPLVWHGGVPARTAVQMYIAGRLAFDRAAQLDLPVLIVHGEHDPIVPVETSRRFLAAVGSADKELLVVPGALHEPHQGAGNEVVIARLVSWLGQH
jgi:acylglycerol lipase